MRLASVISAYIEAKQAAGRAAETMREYRRILAMFAAHYDDLPTAPEPIVRWLGSVEGSQRTRVNHF